MKSFTILLPLLFSTVCCLGQISPPQDSTYWRYAEIIGRTYTAMNKVEIDYGQNVPGWFKKTEEPIDPATGKAIVFHSVVDALNYMSVLGWELVQSYEPGETATLRFLVRRKEHISK